ncbi:hypothetical protein LG200_09715 [Methylobacillus caricis]|uniref:hypothetical protein n=1 Tax=Methylobacillus caricis TaxID=1971611 RepID=UPI001CFFA337|nr:hypothetical protein [Methylobacillus caricis]MCB5188274.1 hypothetical protein [Methylobacillus caricis]
MLRKFFLSYVLSICLLLSQQGALAHQISHLEDYAPYSEPQKQSPHSPFCEKCLNYGSLDSAVTAFQAEPPVFIDNCTADNQQAHSLPHDSLAAYSSRAPPVACIG